MSAKDLLMGPGLAVTVLRASSAVPQDAGKHTDESFEIERPAPARASYFARSALIRRSASSMFSRLLA
jgi:hypothetical protein